MTIDSNIADLLLRVERASGVALSALQLIANRRGSIVVKAETGAGEAVAVKLGLDAEGRPNSPFLLVQRELEVLTRIEPLRNSYLVSGGTLQDPTAAYLVTRWKEAVPLLQPLRRAKAAGQPVAEAIDAAFRASLLAVRDLHATGWCHADLQPDHFLQQADGAVQLIDFAYAQGQPTLIHAKYLGGLVHFNAPEISRMVLEHGEARATAASDIYALGAVMFLAAAGRVLTRHDGNPKDTPWEESLRKIASLDFVPLGEARPHLSPLAFDVLCACLSADPDDRPAAAEALRRLQR
jgi:serine/threonine protein kinase